MKNRSKYKVYITTVTRERETFKYWLSDIPDGHTWGGATEKFVDGFNIQLFYNGDEIDTDIVYINDRQMPQDIQNTIDANIDRMIEEYETDGP